MRIALFVTIVLAAGAVDAAARIRWSAPLEIAAGGGQRGPWQQNASRYDYVDDPSVALDDRGAAAVVFVDQRRKDVFYQVYERSGAPRFARPINVSRSPRIFSWLPRLVVSPARDVFIVWQEIVFSGGSHGGEIFFARSRDGGATFSEPTNLSRSISGDGKGRITKTIWNNGSLDLAIDADGVLHAAWTDYDGALWYCRSRDRGQHFAAPTRIAGDPRSPARAPALAAGPDRHVYLAWTVGEHAAADIRIASSPDGGTTFGAARVVAETPGYSDAPKLAVGRDGTVHVVSAESAGGPFDRFHIRYTRSHDRARTFEPPRELSRPPPPGIASAAFPALDLDAHDGVYVVWELYPVGRHAPRGLALASSNDGGDTFTAPARVPGSRDPGGGWNGSHQGRLMRKLAVTDDGAVAVVNSSLAPGVRSRVWLMRGHVMRAARRGR